MSHEANIADAINKKYRANALRVFISGLKKPLCDILFASKPSDLPSALALAQEVDANHERYIFAASFANRSLEVTRKPDGNQRNYKDVNQTAYNRENLDKHKNPHFVRHANQPGNRFRQENINEQNRNQGFYQNRNLGSQPKQEPMDVDPSLSRLRQPTNYRNGQFQKRQTLSDRSTGPKIQRVNNLNQSNDDESSPESYKELANTTVEDIETEELNFLGESPSCPGFARL